MARVVMYIGRSVPSYIDWSKVTHVCLEYLQPNTTDLGLSLQNDLTESQITAAVSVTHSNGRKIGIAIFTGGNSVYNTLLGTAAARANMINDIKYWLEAYNIDYIDLDWEAAWVSNWTKDLCELLMHELDLAIPSKEIFFTPPGQKQSGTIDTTTLYCHTATANDHIDRLHPMIYDLFSGTDAYYQAHHYGTLDDMIRIMSAYSNAGVRKSILGAGCNNHWRGGYNYPQNWISWKYVITGSLTYEGVTRTNVIPTDAQNQVLATGYDWGFISGMGMDLAKQKAQWLRDNGYDGYMMYTLGADDPVSRSQIVAMSNIVLGTAPPVTYTSIVVNTGANGTTVPAPGTYQVEVGSTFSITAIPATGYRFKCWSNYTDWVDNPTSWTAEGMITIYPVFEPIPYGHVFGPGTQRTAVVPVKVSPSGIACSCEVFIGPDENTPLATSGKVPFVSAADPVPVECIVVMPTQEGTYKAFINIYRDNFILKGFVDDTPITITSQEIGDIVWNNP